MHVDSVIYSGMKQITSPHTAGTRCFLLPRDIYRKGLASNGLRSIATKIFELRIECAAAGTWEAPSVKETKHKCPHNLNRLFGPAGLTLWEQPGMARGLTLRSILSMPKK
jgi:hypothetical protein